MDGESLFLCSGPDCGGATPELLLGFSSVISWRYALRYCAAITMFLFRDGNKLDDTKCLLFLKGTLLGTVTIYFSLYFIRSEALVSYALSHLDAFW